MVKKMKSAAESTANTSSTGKSNPLNSSHLAAAVKDSAQHIWLAGMGAFSKAQEEGTKVFEALVKEGMNLQKKTQGMAEEKLGEVTGKMSAMADTVTSKAGQNWDKLEAIFEQRTAKAMGKLGVPTAKELADLVQRVDELHAKLAKMNGGAAPAKAAKAAKPAASVFTKAAKKVAAKKSPAKKAAGRARKAAAF
jgi:poly(hydroxyalkanoate) granule-associated protein